MISELIKSIFFGMGIIFQVVFLIGYKLNKKDLKKILKSIDGGFLFLFLVLYTVPEFAIKNDVYGLLLASIYGFYFGFVIAFTLSFKKKILLKINEISLFAINIIFLYYCITRFGFDNFFTKIIYIQTFIILLLILFKRKLNNKHNGLIYLWYIILFIIISIINIFQLSGEENNIFSSYLSSFFIGGIFLYIWICFIYLIMFTKILDFFLSKNRYDVRSGRAEFKEHFSDLANSFNKTKISNLKFLILFVVLFSFLIINYYYNYISENLSIAFILFVASITSSRKIDLIKKTLSRKSPII